MSLVPPERHPRVLYIEDDAALGRLMQKQLGRLGYDISVVTSGQEGIKAIAGQGFDLVALDHYLPGMDGITTLGRIRELADPPPVIYVTGSDDSRIAVAALKAGAADYVFKDSSDNFLTLFANAIEQALAQVALRRAKAGADDALREAKERAEQASREKGRLLAAAGHDLKQPLQVLQMALDQLGPAAAPKFHPLLGRCEGALDTLSRAFDTLLQAARLESGALAPRPAPVAMADLLGELYEEWQPPAREKGLEFRMVETSTVVSSDLEMLRTILRNMIGNAVKYTDRGGIVIGCRRRGEAILIQVSDTGIGIEAAVLPSVFDEFHQLEPGARGGLGLGLAIVRGTAEALGHRLVVKSRRGAGSSFGIIVPAAALDTAMLADSAPVRQASAGR